MIIVMVVYESDDCNGGGCVEIDDVMVVDESENNSCSGG